MTRSTLLKLAASSLVLAGTAISCKPTTGAHPLAISSHAPARSDAAAAKLMAQATRSLAKGRPAEATKSAEAAVRLAPQNADARALLGRTYLAGGRFLSAESALADAVTLAPDHRAALRDLALARIALGKWGEARTLLGDARGRMPEADRGLGLALAGQADEAIAVLEPAARAADATSRTRQNLALAYALAGRWGEARTVAAQDLSAAELDQRLSEWALFAQPHAVWEQVATLLHVTPARDPGMPTALALVATPVRAAAAEPVAVPPVDAVEIAAAEPVSAPFAAPAPYPFLAPAAPVVPTPRLAAAGVYAPTHDAPLLRADRSPMKRRVAFARPSQPVLGTQNERGRWAVQLGAFAAPRGIETAWTSVTRRMTMLASYTPSRSRYDRFQRLAISGFATRGEAVAVCARIRAHGGPCFVRATLGDAPIRMAARAKPVQLAAR